MQCAITVEHGECSPLEAEPIVVTLDACRYKLRLQGIVKIVTTTEVLGHFHPRHAQLSADLAISPSNPSKPPYISLVLKHVTLNMYPLEWSSHSLRSSSCLDLEKLVISLMANCQAAKLNPELPTDTQCHCWPSTPQLSGIADVSELVERLAASAALLLSGCEALPALVTQAHLSGCGPPPGPPSRDDSPPCSSWEAATAALNEHLAAAAAHLFVVTQSSLASLAAALPDAESALALAMSARRALVRQAVQIRTPQAHPELLTQVCHAADLVTQLTQLMDLCHMAKQTLIYSTLPSRC